MKRLMRLVLPVLALFGQLALANVEKTIFVAPPPPPVHVHPATVTLDDDLGLDTLAPDSPILRTGLNASFPVHSSNSHAGENQDGTTSWFLLQDLAPGVRYEVRVCWLATQPTTFTLSTYTLEQVTSDKATLASISRFSNARLASLPGTGAGSTSRRNSHSKGSKRNQENGETALFLRIDAVADYFSLSEQLMQSVPPVTVDLVLDPFLGNVFPRSLVSTACWGLAVAAMAVGVSRWVVREIGRVVVQEMRQSVSGAQKKTT